MLISILVVGPIMVDCFILSLIYHLPVIVCGVWGCHMFGCRFSFQRVLCLTKTGMKWLECEIGKVCASILQFSATISYICLYMSMQTTIFVETFNQMCEGCGGFVLHLISLSGLVMILFYLWRRLWARRAGFRQNQQNGMCAQRRLR